MQEDESHFSRHNPFYVVLLFVILSLATFLLIYQQNADEDQLVGGEVSESATEVELATNQEGLPVSEPETGAGGQSQLPCPQGSDGFIHVNAQTGECLEENPATVSPVGDEMPESATEVEPDLILSQIGRPFDFPGNLRVEAESLDCRTIGEVVSSSSGGKELEYIMENLRRHSDDSLSLAERLNLDPSVPYDYLIAFDSHLINSGAKQPEEEIVDYFELYQECALQLSIENAGSQITLATSCGLSLGRHVILEDDAGTVYYPINFLKILCKRATIPFPNGAIDKDTINFILPSVNPPVYIVFNLESENATSVLIEL